MPKVTGLSEERVKPAGIDTAPAVPVVDVETGPPVTAMVRLPEPLCVNCRGCPAAATNEIPFAPPALLMVAVEPVCP